MDAHGSQDLLAQAGLLSMNLAIAPAEQSKSEEIIGGNLNSLIIGLAYSLGGLDKNLPCPSTLWGNATSAIFLCLHQCAKIEDCLIRCELLFHKFSLLHNLRKGDLILFCKGTLRFLKVWLQKYPHLLTIEDVLKLHSFSMKLHKNMVLNAVAYTELTQEIVEFSISTKTSIRSKYDKDIVKDAIHHWNIDVPIVEGSFSPVDWEEYSAAQRLKSSLAGTNSRFKLEIFGAENLLDDVSDEEEEEDHESKDDEKIFIKPRIPVGVDLLTSSHVFEERLWDLDMLEIARQWTLVDHILFKNLNLSSLLTSTSVATPFNFHDSLYGGTKRFVDRFNVASSWLTSSLLTIKEPANRALHISKLIVLAQFMLLLGNFHGLMIILTALQQGCVTRLKISFDLVSAQDLNSMQELKALMTGEKNYLKYREELNTRVAALEGKEKESQNGLVPHLAAHMAAITAIAECLGDYLADKSHLFNLIKWKQCGNILDTLYKLQQHDYSYIPVRLLISTLHRQWSYHAQCNPDSNILAKKFYDQSEKLESADAIKQYFLSKNVSSKVDAGGEASDVSDDSSTGESEDTDDRHTAPPNKMRAMLKKISLFRIRSKQDF